MMFMRRSAQALAACSLLVLVACGGGGGGSSSSSGGPTATVAGVASKGLILNGYATAYRVNSDGTRGESLATTRTSSTDGTYRFEGLPVGALVLVEVTGGVGATMRDETSETPLPIDGDFKLRAAQTTPESGEIALQVTPFSEMAVALAERAGGLTSTRVQEANQYVVDFVGAPVLTTPPQFDNSNRANNPVALKLAAIAKAAQSEALGCTDGDQVAKVQCVVQALADGGPGSEDVVDAVNAAINAVKTELEDTKPELVAQVQPVTLQSPVLSGTPVATGIAAAKALVQSVRELGSALESRDDNSLWQRIQELDASVKDLPDILPSTLAETIGVLNRVIELNGSPEAFSQGAEFTLDSGVPCRGVSATKVDCRVFDNLRSDDGQYPILTQYRIEITKNDNATYSVSTSVVDQDGTWDIWSYYGYSINWNVAPEVLSDTYEAVVSRSSGQQLVLNIDGDFARISDTGYSQIDVQVTVADDRYNVRGNIEQYDAQDARFAQTILNEGSYFELAAGRTNKAGVLRLDLVQTAGLGRIEGVFTGRRLVTGNQPHASFIGKLVDTTPGLAAGLQDLITIDASLTGIYDAEGREADSGRSASLALGVLVPNLNRTIQFTLNNLTELADQRYSFSGRFVNGGVRVDFAGEGNKAQDSQSVITFRHSNISFELRGETNDQFQPLLVDGTEEVVGRYDNARKQVTYADGTFERY